MNYLFVIFLLSVLLHKSTAASGSSNEKRDCSKKVPYLPKTVVNTTDRLNKLRELMKDRNLSAYIVPSTDAHGSEYVKERDKRRKFISGFSGSAGFAIVTMNKAAVWTDGRYFLQADTELDCNWILQKQGEKGVPTATEWLIQVLNGNDVVGIDPFLISISKWIRYETTLKTGNITLKGLNGNLVDIIWTSRPAEEMKKVIVQPLNYTGKSWSDKIKDVQKKMEEKKATAHVVQALDSVAWLLNLRGDEILYNPVFFAYVIVKKNEVLFFVSASKISTQAVQKHLNLNSCNGKSFCIKRKEYNTIQQELENLSNESESKIWLSPLDSHALRLDVADEKILLDYSPIPLMKGKKNEVEMKGMRNANLKDSVALSEFFLYAEKQVEKKAKITELSLGEKMIEFRSKQALYKGLSFPSIIGFGSNGAIIHYTAANATNKIVTDESTLLVDTGSQYSDGSTDITRTVHFGTPTADQKSAFTRILIGQIQLATAVFPFGTYGREVDIFAREALYKNGWDYRHGTGHGIGSYLFIHEGPGRIAKVFRGFPFPFETPLNIGFVLSDEPGYYEDGSFGIRLETAVVVVNASTPNRFNDVDYLTFDPISYFPLQRKLIDESLMTDRQISDPVLRSRDNNDFFHATLLIKWVNDYHEKTRKLVGEELKRQEKTDAYNWLVSATEPLKTTTSASPTRFTTWLSFLVGFVFILIQL